MALTADITRLRQVLINLLGNAIKFTEKGEVVVTVGVVTAAPAEEPGRHTLQFSIADTGLGIPPERLGRLFRSFSQVDASTTRRFGGTGLGLAISKRLCELMGGGIWVESAGVPGQGSTFHFTIRAAAAAPGTYAPPPASLPGSPTTACSSSTTTPRTGGCSRRRCAPGGCSRATPLRRERR